MMDNMTEEVRPVFAETQEALPETQVPTVEESSPCNCDAKLADLTTAVTIQNERITQLVGAVNQVGTMVQSIVDQAGGFLKSFQGMNPMDIIKGALSGRK